MTIEDTVVVPLLFNLGFGSDGAGGGVSGGKRGRMLSPARGVYVPFLFKFLTGVTG